MKTKIIIVILLITLTACSSAQPSADVANTAIAIVQTGAALTPTVTVVVSTPSPLPTEPIIPMITPDAIQVERWREYQTELAKSVLPYDPSPIVLCEWAILGQSNQEVYIWAVCEGVARTSAPVIIYLNIDGTIQQVKAVGYDATRNIQIQKLFPLDIQEKIFSELISNLDEQLTRHLSQRSGYPESLPLIILLATPTATVVYPTPSPLPTEPIIPMITPDAIQVERWQEYQTELARALFSYYREGSDPDAYKDALCEWDILGQSNKEVYVFVVCMVAKGNKDARSPVIIHLESNGAIQKVKLPEPKEANIEMFDYDPFPIDVQEKFCYYFDPFPSDLPRCPNSSMYSSPRLDVLYAHIEYRKNHLDEPPLIVLSATPTTTPIP